MLPLWAWVVIAAVVVSIAAAVIGGILFWKRLVRRSVVGLVRRREAAFAVRRTLEEIMTELSHATDEQIAAFADDPESLERNALAEVAARSHVIADELNTIPLPKHLVPAAEALADAVDSVRLEASRIRYEDSEHVVIERLAEIDLHGVGAAYSVAEEALEALTERYGIDAPSVYGGGLYI